MSQVPDDGHCTAQPSVRPSSSGPADQGGGFRQHEGACTGSQSGRTSPAGGGTWRALGPIDKVPAKRGREEGLSDKEERIE